MPDLEAAYENPQSAARAGWRHTLQVGQHVKLGRLPTQSEWWISDPLISGHHATLLWNGKELQVKERTPPPTNKIFLRNIPTSEFSVGVGESFVIGTTVFTVKDLHTSDAVSQNWADVTIAASAVASRSELRKLTFDNAAVTLRALESVAEVLRLATDEDLLYQSMLKILLEAIPTADAVAIVHIPHDSGEGNALRCNIRAINERGTGSKERFAPSRRLADKAIRREKRSVLYAWTQELLESSNMTVGQDTRPGTPWAVCTPFQDDSAMGLYVAGRLNRTPEVKEGRLTDRELVDHQKIIELVSSLIESTRKSHELERQMTLFRRFLPRRLWGETDRGKLDAILAPRQTDVVVLFCDLRGSCRFAEDGSGNLAEAWDELSGALDEMSQTITHEDGIVAGFQGDAVMAFWGWPDAQPGAIISAARAALRLRERFDRDGWWSKFSCGIGIAMGPAVAGRLGAHDLAKVDVFGPTVNLASRLESMTKMLGVRVMIDPNAAAALSAVDPRSTKFRTRKLAKVRPMGMTQGVELFELLPPEHAPGTNLKEAVRRSWEEAVGWYAAGDWKRARERFQNFFPNDPVAQILLSEMGMAANAPANWDGVVKLNSKS
ncbi:MAG: adenylate/guanylate cyclase domain-containing protein [Gemmataceae bacterium]